MKMVLDTDMERTLQSTDSLKLAPAELRRMLDQLNRQGGGAPCKRQRRLRVPFERSDIILECNGGVGRMARFRVQSRNISSHGIAVLHGQFMHMHRPCVVEIPAMSAGLTIRVNARVERCRFVAGRIHEVAITFAKPIDLSMFVGLNLMDEVRARTEVKDLLADAKQKGSGERTLVKGKALVVEDFESNRKLYAFWLRKLGLEVLEAGNIEHAVELAKKNEFELIMVDHRLGDATGAELARRLRTNGFLGMILAVSADSSSATVEECISGGCDHFLPKGFDGEILQRIVIDRLHADEFGSQHSDKIVSTLASDPDMKPLIDSFVGSLPGFRESLRKAVVEGNFSLVEQLCVNLAEAGKGYGFIPLSEVGQAAQEAAHMGNSRGTDIRRAVHRVLNVITRCAA